ncbi:MAG: hypothetical protein RIE58_05560 [Vicingaceae bacterium]
MFFYGLSLLLMLPFGLIIAGLILAYLIYDRYKEKKAERFEKRSN